MYAFSDGHISRPSIPALATAYAVAGEAMRRHKIDRAAPTPALGLAPPLLPRPLRRSMAQPSGALLA
jgi:hypothetical protein